MHAFQPTFQGNMAKDGNFLLEMMKHRHPMSSNFPTILLFTFILFAASLAAADAKDTLLSGQCISGNETLISKSGVFELGFFAYDGWYKYNLGIRYKNLVERTPVFLVQYPTHFSIGAPLCFLKDKLYTIGDHYPSENVLWSSEGNGSAASVAILLDTGNFVVRDEMNPSVVMWQSFDYQD
ncbi:S-locus-specific glycoprotein S13-like isoform X2 [Panicum hallii]|uniref:S-locus-specific glycoprotein S13-like isoform X2 n=1 Tax=Panicum hallii TaxID=206008 RepID=UPI000DF4F175|nr:S-locus-specific glycoprotein S13-like isoform X2 [Panicum hallii]